MAEQVAKKPVEAATNGLARFELKEGRRIAIKTTVREDKAAGRILRDGPGVNTPADPTVPRSVTKYYIYPFPEGMVSDPVTGKMAETTMSPEEIGKRIGQWLADIDEFRKCDGRVTYTNANGKVVATESPVKWLPDLIGEGGLIEKGFKLAIQGPANVALADKYLVKGQGKTTRAGKTMLADLDSI